MGCRKVLLVIVGATFCAFVKAAHISDADLLGLSKQEIDNDSERLFEYVKTTAEGIRLGCKGKVRKGDTGKVQALFIEDQTGRREVRKLGPVKAKVKSQDGQYEEDKYVPLRDFPMYCLERVFTSSTCPPGPSGKQGREGRNGTIGIPGTPGRPGKNGIPGYDGEPGVKGPTGSRGIPGERGDRGDTGPQGAPGQCGPEGPRGTDGIDGQPGTPGSPGESGLPGAAGKPGIDGRNGLDGPVGLPGANGVAGIPGPDGLPGIPGLAGNNGYNGNPGFDGQNGVDGLQGVPGKCCNGDPSGGWSSDQDTCPPELGLEDDTEGDSVSSAAQEEEEIVKTENKPTHGLSKPSSFWGSDMFSSLNPQSYFNFKNNQKNMNRKGEQAQAAQKPGKAPSKPAEKVVGKGTHQ